MKHWNRRLPIKILCFILTVPLLLSVALSIVGVTFLWSEGFYYTNQDAMKAEAFRGSFQWDMHKVMKGLFCDEDSLQPSIIFSDYTSLRFGIYSPDGTLLYSTDHNEGIPYFPKELDASWQDFYMMARFTVHVAEDGSCTVGALESSETSLSEPHYTAYGYVDTDSDIWDPYWVNTMAIDVCYSLRYWIYPILLLLMVLFLFCFINLLATAGRRPKSDELYPGRLDWCPTDVLAVAVVLLMALWFSWLNQGWYWADNVREYTTAIVFIYAGQGLLMLLASRIKRHQLLKNTLICKLLRVIWILMKALPMIWKTVVLALGLAFWNFLMLVFVDPYATQAALMLIIETLAVTASLLWSAIALRKLQKGGKALAEGDLVYHVDTAGMFGALKAHGENLNSIADGMSKAVERQMQSERMKTELITNVSHDIKNPLTSIINYSELIAQETCDNEHHNAYAQVLGRKSQHLKRLLEDLVEVSKATTGNLDMELMPCQAGVLLEQLAGEFQERCQQADLSLLVRQPEETLHIMADSRRIWRVFENLMSNACKYSLPGSRVYLSLEKRGNAAVFTFRNTSREPLDISPEELIERFVRGDSARSTEGNGLGLSIAQSLTSLQGGEMNLGIDGDLFKVTLAFPLVDGI